MKLQAILRRALVDLLVLVLVFFLWTSSLIAPVFAVDAEVEGVSSETESLTYPYTKTFTITAYYSPLPCQDKYVTGSYDSDRRLNGNGVAGADGTGVFPGMVAAPSTYDFGTKMYIPGVGTVSVHDRGGAIVPANSAHHDRLDIWMGYGDIGLQRALQWGKRDVEVTVFGLDDSIQEIITLTPVYTASEAVPNCDESEEGPLEEQPAIVEPEPVLPAESIEPIASPEVIEQFEGVLEFGDSGEAVEQLQEELASLNFLRSGVSGVYDDVTRHAVFKFQQSQYLAGDITSPGAGVFGPKTSSALNAILAKRYESKKLIAAANQVDVLAFSDGGHFTAQLDFGDAGPNVKFLQNFLQDQGYFDYEVLTSYFGPVTKEALIAFQLDYGIIESTSNIGAGRVGPGTLGVINSLL